ncbi:hypothetical protein MRB53_007573 [Persea americana]|uniref:Uncharacterized protein n=1 Tax=Persea americana TaxID=3435 RepID=A0ACC2MJL4_PERAE|nr:hypothetical protein MRB53_007573 [Persea americana]
MERGGGGIRLPGVLDPGAAEFRPKIRTNAPPQQQQIFYPYQSYAVYDSGAVMGYQQQAVVRPGAAATRALLLSQVPSHVTESMVRMELEAFGGVRAVEMGRVGEGIVTVHFYDVRQAQAALVEIQGQHMRQQRLLGRHYWAMMGRNSGGVVRPPVPLPVPVPVPGERGLIAGHAVWAEFAVPRPEIGGDGNNQGTLVVFNLDSGVSSCKLKEIFEAFGPVKELRETPLKRQHRFVEFYDVRDAARALSEMNGKELYGKRLVVEFSRPGGQGKRLSTASSSSNTTHYRRNVNQNHPPHIPQNILQNQKKPNLSKATPVKNEGERGDCSTSRRNFRRPSQAKQPTRRFPSRHHKKQSDSNFLFNEDAMDESICRDSRTTVMIKNIPNKYSQKLLLNMLDNHCIHCNEQIVEGDDEPLSSYDFVYLPIDFLNKCNVGYGFVNLTSPKAAWRLHKSFHSQPWEVFNSRKICQVTYARLQGLEALKEHFKNSKFACDTDEYMPVAFSPPRDGKQLTEPVAIGGQASSSNASKKVVVSSSSGSSKKSEEDDDHDPSSDGGDSSKSNQTDGSSGVDDDGGGGGGDGDDQSTGTTVEIGGSNNYSPSPIAAC